VLGVAKSAYCAWEKRLESARKLEDKELTKKIKEIHEKKRHICLQKLKSQAVFLKSVNSLRSDSTDFLRNTAWLFSCGTLFPAKAKGLRSYEGCQT